MEEKAYFIEGHSMRGNEKLLVVVAALLSAFDVMMRAGVCLGILEGTAKYSFYRYGR